MASTKLVLRFQDDGVADAVREFTSLYRGGAGVPTYLRDRVDGMLANRGQGFLRFERLTVSPGHELLAILATLRAIRGASCSLAP